MLNKIAKMSTLISAGLIFLGFLKLKFFYQSFNISILEYISFSEIITSFLDDLHLMMILGLLMLLQSGPLINLMQRKSGLSIKDFYSNLMKALFPHRYKLVFGFFALFIIIVSMLVANWISYNLVVIYVLLFASLQICHYLSLFKDEDGEIEISDLSLFLSLILPVTLAVFLLAQRDVEKVFEQPVNVSIENDSGSIICGKEQPIKYLGKTADYLFFYNQDSKVASILSIHELKKIEILTKR